MGIKNKIKLFIFFFCTVCCCPIVAQLTSYNGTTAYNPDSIRSEIDHEPYFYLFKDNYLIGGTSLSQKPNSVNSDVKIQVSIKHRLASTKFLFDSYLFIAYTHKMFWNVFQESMPMNSMTFNPAVGLSRPMIRNNKYIGKSTLLFEHESNGKDGVDSRSWERITFSTALLINKNLETQFKIWLPLIDGENNKDILKYNGIFQISAELKPENNKLRYGVILTKRSGFNMNFNTALELSYKTSSKSYQYFFLQYYNGYGDNLLYYNKFESKLRAGFVIKPKLFSFY